MQLGKHAKVGLGWTFITSLGIFLFYLSKSSVDKRRYENMKVRERMRLSNIGEYDLSPRQAPKS